VVSSSWEATDLVPLPATLPRKDPIAERCSLR